jgi:hypothetical protein
MYLGMGMCEQAPRANGYDDSYSGKRDRWNGYDPGEYLRVMKKHELITKERQAIREMKVDESLKDGSQIKDKVDKHESGGPRRRSARECVFSQAT